MEKYINIFALLGIILLIVIFLLIVVLIYWGIRMSYCWARIKMLV